MPTTKKTPPKRRPVGDIANHGRKAAAKKAAATVEKIARAKRAIEAEIERYGGVYPYAGGRLTADEVLRRAGLNRTLLQKPRHSELNGQVKTWLENIAEKRAKGKDVVRKAVTDRVDSSEDELSLIRQRWAEAELEFVEQANEVARLIRKCAELEEEIASLKIEASRNKFAQLDPNDVAEFVRDLLSNSKPSPQSPLADPT